MSDMTNWYTQLHEHPPLEGKGGGEVGVGVGVGVERN